MPWSADSNNVYFSGAPQKLSYILADIASSGGSLQLIIALQILIAETIYRMVIDHAHGLHKSVNDSRADEAETTLLQILTYCFRQLCFGRQLRHRLPGVVDGLAVHKPPSIGIEAAKLFLYLEKSPGVFDRQPADIGSSIQLVDEFAVI